MNSAIWMCLYLCAIISLAWCADANPDKVDETQDETPSKGDADPTEGKEKLPLNPDEDANSAKKIVMRITIVLFVVCVIVGLYFVWRCTRSRPNVRTKAGSSNYRRVRNSMPADDMGGERGEDGEDEETLYDRTESTSQF